MIGVVGPCAAGKSTLVKNLAERGVSVKHIAQEHSYVADMWQRLTNPDLLIYLDVSYDLTTKRKNLNWREVEYLRQVDRLSHAREHADLYIATDNLSPLEVSEKVLYFLQKVG